MSEGVAAAAQPPPTADDRRETAVLDELLQGLLEQLSQQDVRSDPAVIQRAFALAKTAHASQKRQSGEPYLVHPVRVAQIIARFGLDQASVVAALLHDSVEDSELSIYDLTEEFGRDVAGIVDGVTKLGKVPYLSRREQQAESFRKMLVAMSRDIRVLLVKLADRLDNMRTLEHVPADKQERISRETMDIYAPLAHRLGIDWLRRELQNLSFRYLEPVTYAAIAEQASRLRHENPEFPVVGVETLTASFSATQSSSPDPWLDEQEWVWNVERFGPVEVRATMRSPYQLQMVTQETGRRLEQVSDLGTYQIITRDRTACYAALGALHAHFKPVPGRFRDYVALPRPNQYRALHTAVVDREGVRLEIQIRSQEMEALAQRGIIARFERTGALGVGPGNEGQGLTWLGQLMDWQGEVQDPSEFIEAVKADLFADEVYVFTPQGDIHTFPRGATPIDFAFAIHTDVGMHCSGARVNGQVVPLRYRLRQGDTVEIITNPNYGPRTEWMKMCATPRAIARVKHHLRAEERTRLETLGRNILEQEMSSRGVRLPEWEQSEEVAQLVEGLGLGKDSRGVDGVYEAVGAGRISAWDAAEKLVPGARDDQRERRERNLFARMLRKMGGRDRGPRRTLSELGDATKPILITQERVLNAAGDSLIQLAPCCSPIPGDPLIGFFAPGRGLVAHLQGCPEALEQLSDQRVYLAWGDDLDLDCPVTLEVKTENKVGLLAQMSRVFSQHGVNIRQANCRAEDDTERAVNTFHASVRNASQLHAVVADLKSIPGVIGVGRVFHATAEA